MAELSKLAKLSNDMCAAYDERTRLFTRLRDLHLDDETRQAAINDYALANRAFDEAKSHLTKSEKR